MRQATSILLLCIFFLTKASILIEWCFDQGDTCSETYEHICEVENHDQGNLNYLFSDDGKSSQIVSLNTVPDYTSSLFVESIRNISNNRFITVCQRGPPVV